MPCLYISRGPAAPLLMLMNPEAGLALVCNHTVSAVLSLMLTWTFELKDSISRTYEFEICNAAASLELVPWIEASINLKM